MSQGPTNTLRGNSRNNHLYGTATSDGIDGDLGNDYLRGYAGNDVLWGGAGSDRFVFERTLAQNGIDTIKDYTYAPGGGDVDVLDFSLVGFARNALSRNSGENGIDNVIRFVEDGNGARVELSLTGAGGETFTQWAVLEGLSAGDLVQFSIGARTFTRPVQAGAGLRFDIGNGDRNGDGSVTVADNADNNLEFDDFLAFQPSEGNPTGAAAAVLIGDRVRGLTEVADFVPGVTTLAVPGITAAGGDAVGNQQFAVYYGTYDGTTFTTTSTPGTTRNPTTATHTMVLYDTDASASVNSVGGLVLEGVYAENQWSVTNPGTQNATLAYDRLATAGLAAENVLYGTAANESFIGGNGIDIIYAGAGNDRLYGSTGYWMMGEPADGNDWLFGGEGADTFFATREVQGGVDVIQDFDGAEGDLIALAIDGTSAESAAVNGLNGNVNWSNTAHILVDRGDITADGPNLQAAMAAEFNAAGSSVTVYQFGYDGRSYLYWDAFGNNYNTMASYDDVVVEITGAVNLSASNIYLYLLD